jgi:NAD(P)-dependent dehydrogenase (short-subunit alcohol dehydrogenase family)
MSTPVILGGRRALITGGAAGIGRATALLLARHGAAVAIADLNEAGAHEVAAAIQADGGRAIAIGCDVTRSDDCRRAVDATVDAFGGLDILFNNAGIIRRADVVETTEDEWDRVMAVNVKSVFLMSKFAVPVMAADAGGSIVNTASGWGLKGGARAVSYCASKGAVVIMTRAMAIDHGAQNIRVNCICPGDTDTGMLADEARQLGEPDDRFRAEAAARPLNRLGQPLDIANAVLYLVSDQAAWVTGTSLIVDGGGLA